ncbi:MAG: hypothetical protein KGJ38_15290, partial [Burkholderiaceae bacterium]|nr:hypothetical protein [Burkholderiaceae bacterium]
VVVLAPIWMGHLASPMRDFLKDQMPLPAHLSVVCVMAARGAFRAVEEIAQITASIPTPVLALCQRDVLSGLSQEEVAGFIDQVRVAGHWGQTKRRPAWLSPSEA